MPKLLVFDFSRAPNPREAVALRKRIDRIDAMEASARTSMKHLSTMQSGRGPDETLRLRNGYSCLKAPATPGGSDRVLPPRDQRPPVTRLTTPRGAALRLHLIALSVAQFNGRPGRSTPNVLPLRPRTGDDVGWTDLLASTAIPKTDGRVLMTAQDKRVRQLQSALDAQKEASLIWLPNAARGAGKYEGFELLEESAVRAPGEDPIPYRVPKKTDPSFLLPDTFMTNGWVHVLEDTEIALLLMTACGIHSIETDAVAIPAFHRVQHYGIGRDAFEAHRWLDRFGLLDVVDVNRHFDDGRSIDYAEEGSALHRLHFKIDGLSQDGITTVRAALDAQLARASAPTKH